MCSFRARLFLPGAIGGSLVVFHAPLAGRRNLAPGLSTRRKTAFALLVNNPLYTLSGLLGPRSLRRSESLFWIFFSFFGNYQIGH